MDVSRDQATPGAKGRHHGFFLGDSEALGAGESL